MDQNRLNQQSNYWEDNFFSKPKMFGLDPSIAAISSLKKFKDENIDEIVVQQQLRLLKRRQKKKIFQN